MAARDSTTLKAGARTRDKQHKGSLSRLSFVQSAHIPAILDFIFGFLMLCPTNIHLVSSTVPRNVVHNPVVVCSLPPNWEMPLSSLSGGHTTL